MKIVSLSEKETKKIACDFARNALGRKGGNRAFVVALSGELGAGKTTFVQGFARGLGLRKRVVSPTFVLVRRHNISRGRFQNFYHIDAYRVRNKRDLVGLGLKEIFAEPRNIVLVEWAENVRALLPKGAIWVKMKHGEHQNERIIVIK